jgi:hypothetical protein
MWQSLRLRGPEAPHLGREREANIVEFTRRDVAGEHREYGVRSNRCLGLQHAGDFAADVTEERSPGTANSRPGHGIPALVIDTPDHEGQLRAQVCGFVDR